MVRPRRRSHPDDGPVTVLVEFSLTSCVDEVASVASTVADTIAESLSWRPGFLSATTMVSADGRHMVAIARWAGPEAWLAATHCPEATTPCLHGERELHWLAPRDSDQPLLGRLAEAGATVQRVQVLHEVQTVASLVPRPARTAAPRSRRAPVGWPATADGGLLRTRPHLRRNNPRSSA